jgi:hypothetical protein
MGSRLRNLPLVLLHTEPFSLNVPLSWLARRSLLFLKRGVVLSFLSPPQALLLLSNSGDSLDLHHGCQYE